ncbi:MAG: hypothetical protein CMI16_00795 [Opitutaceae bacterium]|nr:hypothetical protein [Opitutaceae bacterium]
MGTKLFHVSESPDIECFEPRSSPSKWESVMGPVVWAVDEAHLVNYLFPRDCPRVTYYPLPNSTPADIERLMGATGSRHVVCIEEGWLDRVSTQKLCVYELPTETFSCVDSGAGYFVSPETIRPKSMKAIDSLIDKIGVCGAEFRVLPSLWNLSDDVSTSSLQFSCIRMRNALPRGAS